MQRHFWQRANDSCSWLRWTISWAECRCTNFCKCWIICWAQYRCPEFRKSWTKQAIMGCLDPLSTCITPDAGQCMDSSLPPMLDMLSSYPFVMTCCACECIDSWFGSHCFGPTSCNRIDYGHVSHAMCSSAVEYCVDFSHRVKCIVEQDWKLWLMHTCTQASNRAYCCHVSWTILRMKINIKCAIPTGSTEMSWDSEPLSDSALF